MKSVSTRLITQQEKMSILCNYETQMTQIIKIQRYYKKNIKNVCIEIIEEQIDKENKNNIWINSKYYFLTRLEITPTNI